MSALRILKQQRRLDFKIFEGVEFAILRSEKSLEEIDLSRAGGIFIENDNSEVVLEILRELYSSDNPDVYLQPTFIKSVTIPSSIVELTDGRAEDNAMHRCIQKAISITKLVEQINADTKDLNFSKSIILKTAQYVFTRQQPLVPFRNRVSKIGYSFPFLGAFISEEDNLMVLDKLDKATDDEYFKGRLIDKVNVCHECDGSYLNFRETCQNCQSMDLKAESLIHHFRCAYIGPESDFKKKDDLVCPKCDKLLRHIGIDYDKPSEINHCNSCGHQSQEAMMKAGCVDCGTEIDLEFIITRNVRTFQTTAAGEKLALRGFSSTSGEKLEKPTFETSKSYFGWGIFKVLFQQEIERLEVGDHESHFGVIKLNEEEFEVFNEQSKQVLQKEILSEVGQYLRKVDLLSYRDFSTYVFLMPESTSKLAIDMKETIEYNLKKLIGDNSGLGQGMLEVGIERIDPQSEEILEMLE